MANLISFHHEKLDVGKISEMAILPSCGAVSLFVGTTRDEFEGKEVVKLEYEAYETMGVKVLEGICAEIRSQWPSVGNIVVQHRLGPVPVTESGVVIAISSPHRGDAIKATEFCINKLKESVPIWKKEVYSNNQSSWKENTELETRPKKRVKFEVEQEVELDYIPPHLIQIKASKEELERRISKFIERKREEINAQNKLEFSCGDCSEFSCARIDSTVRKKKGSKSHLQVERVLNSYQHRDQRDSNYMKKYIPKSGIEERLHCLESQLSMEKPVPTNIYHKLKNLENRLIFLESVSPEYVQFWDQSGLGSKAVKKKIFLKSELDEMIAEIEKKCL